jgi:DNA repair exonuclease SbcCD ATPase subunit
MSEQDASDQKDVKQPEPSGDVKPEPARVDNTVPYERFKEINDRMKALEADLNKRTEAEKKALEDKAIEEGKLKDVLATKESELASLQEKAEKYEEQEQKLRKSLIDKLDDRQKKIAKGIPDIDNLKEYVDSIQEVKPQEPVSGKGQGVPPAIDIRNFKGSFDDLVAALKAAGAPIDYGQ